MTLTALLTAITFIPIAMPLKLVIHPASYTRKPPLYLYRDVYQSMDGHLRRSCPHVILLFPGRIHSLSYSARYPIFSLRHWSLFPTKYPKTHLENRKRHGFSTSYWRHSRSRRSTTASFYPFQNGSAKHVLRSLLS